MSNLTFMFRPVIPSRDQLQTVLKTSDLNQPIANGDEDAGSDQKDD